jgi:hypothetical protein
MESPIPGICVFARASRAHGEVRHARAFTVVRKRADHRKPRATQGAGDERIEIAVVPRVKKLGGALATRCDVRRNWRNRRPFLETLLDAKAALTRRRNLQDMSMADCAR